MNRIQIAICDDNRLCLMELKERLLKELSVDNVFPFSDIDSLLFSIEDGNIYDAVMMDIDLGQGGNGIDAAERLYRLCPETKIIYVTGHSEYSQHIFLQQANLSGFLTKPVDQELLKANLQKIANQLPFSKQQTILLRQRGNNVPVLLREIYFIESRGRTLETHTAGGDITSYGQLKEMAQSLPAWFIQCHKSYVVNMRQIQRFNENTILLKNGSSIPASRSKYKKTKEAYFHFIGDHFL